MNIITGKVYEDEYQNRYLVISQVFNQLVVYCINKHTLQIKDKNSTNRVWKNYNLIKLSDNQSHFIETY